VAQGGALPKVTIVSGGTTLNHAPQMVASKRGLFLEEGLDAEYSISSQGASVVVAAVLNGQALLGCTGGPAAISPISKNAPIKIVIVIGSRYAAEITISHKFLQAKGVTPQSPLEQKVLALKGAKLGIYTPGDSTDQLARYLFKRYGVNADSEVELVSTQNAQNMLAAFRRGSVDGIMVSPPTGVQAENEGLGQIFIRGEDEPTLNGYPYAVCFASVAEIGQRPQVVASAVAALARSARLLRTEPEQVKADVRSFFPDFDPKIFDVAYASAVGAIPESVIPTEPALRVLQDFSRAQGAEVTYTFDQAMDPRPAQQAMKKLGW
jgi:NitT/TauT family transport system substrate-binding protein